MRRKGGFYNYILVLPCVLLSALTTVLFWLPPESPAKMLLGMNIFTSFFVLLLLLSKNVPSATDKIPLIGAYYCLNMLMIATSTCACTVVVHIFFRGQGKVPYLLRKIFLEFLGRLLCMELPATLPPPPPTQTTTNSLPTNSSASQYPNKSILQSALADKSNTNKNRNSTKINTNVQFKPTNLVTSINNINNATSSQLINGSIQINSCLNRNNTSRSLKEQFSSVSCTSIDLNEEINRQLETAYQLNSPNDDDTNNNLIEEQEEQEEKFITKMPTRTVSNLQSQSINTKDSIVNNNNNNNNNVQHTHTHLQSNQLNNELNLSFNLIENDIKEIRDYLRHTRKKLETTDLKTKQTNEWKQVALILDRTLFFIYIIAMFISITLVLHA